MQDKHDIIISKEKIISRIKTLANQINSDYAGKTLDLVCLVNSAQFFTSDLVKHLTIPTRLHYLGFNSYLKGNETGEVRLTSDIQEPLFGRDVLVIEAIVVSGRTPKYIMDLIKNRKPNSLNLCALGSKPHLLSEKLPLRYIAFELGKEILVGYGIGSGPEKTLPFLISKKD
ncbi:MAG: hypoxanthine phosphoribosyltransferase [Flavobacteriaceae bacterium]|nr:hypoxanthine phosphoribosyltransferase [Flavobacteriaceae bacterium]